MNWMPYGPNGVLLRFADTVGNPAFHLARTLAAELEHNPPPGLVEFVPAFTTILLEFDPHETPPSDLPRVADELVDRLGKLPPNSLPKPRIKKIPVVYDGPDLQRVAKSSGLTVPEVCRRHASPLYNVYMLGFAPGFPYLGDLDPQLHTPRLASPRPRVPKGSVAIGGPHTGIYSTDSPGGWNIIGHTSLPLFDRQRFLSGAKEDEAFFLKPGDQVQFVPA